MLYSPSSKTLCDITEAHEFLPPLRRYRTDYPASPPIGMSGERSVAFARAQQASLPLVGTLLFYLRLSRDHETLRKKRYEPHCSPTTFFWHDPLGGTSRVCARDLALSAPPLHRPGRVTALPDSGEPGHFHWPRSNCRSEPRWLDDGKDYPSRKRANSPGPERVSALAKRLVPNKLPC